MDRDTIRRLNDLNKRFYETVASDFHETRGAAWPGWLQLLPHIQKYEGSIRVLDVGCGNGRFGAFLTENLPNPIDYHGIDNNAQLLDFARHLLADKVNNLTLTQQDIVERLHVSGQYDLVVLFGVIHHIPGYQNRQHLMAQLTDHIASGGWLVFAVWRFYEYQRFRKRIISWDADWSVERHDYLLDWQRDTTATRYAHYVDDDEHQALIGATGLQEIITYRADGNTGDLNQYSVLKI
ncbi:MAG: class I SAM-dependent methyltransferase [Chloroflexi bacterium]|nr:class I SAM-dependent methyltransferase [Chloroflexota bacterium]